MIAHKSSTGSARPGAAEPAAGEQARRCGLCGKTSSLRKTECCDQWVCDDEGSYVLFSYARNSCSRNHRRYTLCGYHHTEGHDGDWRECAECREAFETETYVHYGTNEHNFVKLEDPPAFEPTLCSGCGTRLNLGEGGYVYDGDGYQCLGCAGIDLGFR